MATIRRALVIGGTGFIGSALLRRLVADGVDAHALMFRDRIPRSVAAGTPLAAASSQVADLAHAFAGPPFDAVFHLAAAGVDPASRSPEALLDGNLGLLTRVLESLHASPPGIIVYTGSCAEYSEPQQGTLIEEDWPTLPGSLYGAAKAASTIVGTALAQRLDMAFITLRLFHVFGPGEASYRLVPSLIDSLSRNQPLKLTAGCQVRDFLHIDDVVDALISAASCIAPRFSVFNVCSGRPTSVRDVALHLARLLDRPAALLNFGALPYRSDEQMWLAGSNRRFVEATGWAPKLALEEGLKSMAAPGEEA
jgi:UDP-glucose 4-epimerase